MEKGHIGKRRWITAFILVLCMSFLVCTSAFANYTEEVPEISLNERQCVEQAMISRGSSHNICVEPLYDFENAYNFLLGTSNNSYVIISRATMHVLEGGEANPYANYVNEKNITEDYWDII